MKALVVGYGRMGGFHAKVLRDLGYEVVTVDPDPSRMADYLSLDFAVGVIYDGSQSRGLRSFDVAAVAVPPGHLVETAYQLAGLPMLVEKPFALNVRDAQLLAAYLKQSGSRVCVGFVERFNPQARALRALLRDGTLRDVTAVKFTRVSDRPSFDVGLDLRLHDLDLAAFIGAWGPGTDVSFETRAGAQRKVRTIEVTHAEGVTTVDLCAHDLSPLHGLWHAFLTEGAYPGPDAVIDALRVLPYTFEHEAMAVAA